MRITNQDRSSNVSMKTGLNIETIETVKKMPPRAYESIVQNLKNQHGINANVAGSNTVAFCLKAVADTMSKLGFKLPKNFEFSPAEMGALGLYYPRYDTVVINSNYDAFENLTAQNKLEESQKGYHPMKGHFLHTYFHEFSHAAHYKNLCERHGNAKGFDLMMNVLSELKPTDAMVGPFNMKLKRMFYTGIDKIDLKMKEILNNLFPLELGQYAYTELTEYMAEYNARKVEETISPSFNLENLMKGFIDYEYSKKYPSFDITSFYPIFNSSNYHSHPSGYSLKDELKGSKFLRLLSKALIILPGGMIFSLIMRKKAFDDVNEILKKDLEYTNGDIWHGEIDKLLKNNNISLGD